MKRASNLPFDLVKEFKTDYHFNYTKDGKTVIATYAIDFHGEEGRTYIGSTQNFYDRWRHHRCDLMNGASSNFELQQLFDEYGPEWFTMRILHTYPRFHALDEVSRRRELVKREIVDGRAYCAEDQMMNRCLGNVFINGWIPQLCTPTPIGSTRRNHAFNESLMMEAA